MKKYKIVFIFVLLLFFIFMPDNVMIGQTEVDIQESKQEAKEETQIRVNDINITEKDNVCRVNIAITQGVNYKLMELKEKKFLVLDILEANYNLTRSVQYVNNAFIEKIRSSQYQTAPFKIVRIVFELKDMFAYQVEKTGSGMDIVFEQIGQAQETDKTKQEAVKVNVSEQAEQEESEDKGLISMDFRDVDINNVLRMFSYKTGVNIVAGSEVQGKITIRLTKVPWEHALKTILEINGFTYDKQGDIIRVASVAKIKAERQSRQDEEISKLKAAEAAKPLIPLSSKTIFISYADVEGMKATLSKLLSERGNIMTDKRTNAIILSDMAENIKKIEEMIGILDKRTPQVIIETKLIEIKGDDTKRLGINWGTSSGTSGGIKTINPSGRVNVDVGLLPAISGTSNITVGTVIDNFALNAALHAMLDQGATELLASPKVATLDNERAVITIGKKVPIRLLDEDGRPVTKLIPVGIRLEVKPHITADNHISMDIKPEVSYIEPQPVSQGEIEINTTEAQTVVMVKDTQTAVIGGLIRKDISQTENKIPFLSNIPFIGFFFKNKANSNSRKELLIFVTPHIITDEEMKNEAFIGLKKMEEIDLEKSEEEIAREKEAEQLKKQGKSAETKDKVESEQGEEKK